MKKLLAILIMVSVVCCFTACSSTKEAEDNTSSEEEVTFNPDADYTSETSSSGDGESENTAESTNDADDDEQNNTDSTTKTNKEAYEFGGISIVLPKNFKIEENNEDSIVAYPKTYPNETDSISLNKSKESIDSYSEENVNKNMKTLNTEYEGCKNYKKFTVDGCDAVRYDHTITVGGITVEQEQVAVFADETVVVTFTNVSGNYLDDGLDSLDSIKVVK